MLARKQGFHRTFIQQCEMNAVFGGHFFHACYVLKNNPNEVKCFIVQRISPASQKQKFKTI